MIATKGMSRTTKLCLCFLIFGILLKLRYAFMAGYDISHHDLGDISNWETITHGHLGYIQYLFQFKHFPDFYPLGSQFYHPPFFHIIGALVLEFTFILGRSIEAGFEYLQILNMMFACLGSVYVYKLAGEFEFSNWVRILVVAIASFHPIFFTLGMSLNNDCLMTTLLIMALFYTLKWAKQPCLKHIIKIALCYGFAIFTKTSAFLLAPAIAAVFLYVLIKDKTSRKELIIQFITFALLCMPIGLFWITRSYFVLELPPNYVLKQSVDSGQYLGNIPWQTRFLLPSFELMTSYNFDVFNTKVFCNIWGLTAFTSVFDEGHLFLDTPTEQYTAIIMMWSSVLLGILLLIDSTRMLFSKFVSIPEKLLLAISYTTLMVSYVIFFVDFPHVCTANYRYIAVTLFLNLAGFAYFRSVHPHTNQIYKKIICSLSTLFCTLSILLYLVSANNVFRIQ